MKHGNENQRIICVDKAGNAISKLYASQVTKNVLVDCSAEPLLTHWDGEMANE